MHQQPVALGNAAFGQRRRQRRNGCVNLAPGPGPLAPDEANAVAMPAGILGDEISQIHHPVRHPGQAAPWRGSRHFDTPNVATHKPYKIIAMLLKSDKNVPIRTLAECTATASAQAPVHSDQTAIGRLPAAEPHAGREQARVAGAYDHFGILSLNGVVVMRFSRGHEGLPWPPQ